MQIILTKNVENLGKKGDVKNVKDGYYRNFLAPRKVAKVANPNLLEWAKKLQEQSVKEKEEVVKNAEEIKKKLEGLTITFEEKTTDKDTLYGSIGEKELVKALEEQGKVKLKKKQIDMAEHIKTVGKHKVTVKLTDEVHAKVKVEIKGK
ncbi:50S ribosomal protein L9 [Patescibacteria group bacterium]